MHKLIVFLFHILENVALNKPAFQQYPYEGYNTDRVSASDAVDGLKLNESDFEDHCILSAERKETATLWVNLTRIISIHHIILFYMTDNTEWGM